MKLGDLKPKLSGSADNVPLNATKMMIDNDFIRYPRLLVFIATGVGNYMVLLFSDDVWCPGVWQINVF